MVGGNVVFQIWQCQFFWIASKSVFLYKKFDCLFRLHRVIQLVGCILIVKLSLLQPSDSEAAFIGCIYS